MEPKHTMSCLSRVPIFMHLDGAEKAEVHDFLHPTHVKKGDYVARSGSDMSRLFVLNRGSAKIVRTNKDGREQIVRLLKPGDYIGELAVFAGTPPASDVIAVEDSSFCTLDRSRLRELLLQKPGIALRLLGDLSTRLEKAESYAESLGMSSAEERLYDLFVELAAGEPTFRLPATKKDIAARIGIAPETFSRTFKKLQSQQRIAVQGKSITLL